MERLPFIELTDGFIMCKHLNDHDVEQRTMNL